MLKAQQKMSCIIKVSLLDFVCTLQKYGSSLGNIHIVRTQFFKIFDPPPLPLRNAKPYKSQYFYKAS